MQLFRDFTETLAFDDNDNIYVSSPNKLHKFNSDFTVMACVDNNFNDLMDYCMTKKCTYMAPI